MDDKELSASEEEDTEESDAPKPAATTWFVIAAGVFVAGFYFLNRFTLSKFPAIFHDLRVDLPMPTNVTLWMVRNAEFSALSLALAACFVGLWKRRAAMILFLVGIGMAMGLEVVSTTLAIVKIQEALRKK